MWSVLTGKEVAILKGHEGRVNGARFSPDDLKIVTASSDKTARVWDVATGEEILLLLDTNTRSQTHR